jgi:hypothetical protein
MTRRTWGLCACQDGPLCPACAERRDIIDRYARQPPRTAEEIRAAVDASWAAVNFTVPAQDDDGSQVVNGRDGEDGQ